MLLTAPNLATVATLEGAPAGLTLTARIVDGDETLTITVTVVPKLDSTGDPLDAYMGSFIAPASLPVMIEWLDGATVVGREVVVDGAAVPVPATVSGLVEIAVSVTRVGPEPQKALFAVDGADVFIQGADGSAAIIWADSAGTVALSSPLVSDNGRVTGWVPAGQHLRSKAVLPGVLDPAAPWEYFHSSGPPGPPGIQGPPGMLTEVTQVAEGNNTPVFKVVAATAGAAPFHVQMQSYPNSGAGSGTYNHGVWFGWNAARFAGGVATAGKHGLYMGFEDNYFDHAGDGTYGAEWYVGYLTPDGTTIGPADLRPFYCRVKDSDVDAANKSVITWVDIGAGATGSFNVMGGQINGTELLVVTRTITYNHIPTWFMANPADHAGAASVSVRPLSGYAQLDLKAPGVGVGGHFSVLAFMDVDTYRWSLNGTTGEFYITDVTNASRRHVSLLPGATDAAASTVFNSSVAVMGDVGFYGTVPIVKRGATADATDLATVVALANALKADLQAYGLKA